MIRVRCHCGKSLKLPPAYVGKPTSCPQCHGRVRVVAGAAIADERRLQGVFLLKTGKGGDATQPEQIFLAGDAPIEIGKSVDAHLRLVGSSVSRRHGRLESSARGWRIQDANSTNGLYVNGRRVRGHNLIQGDVVRIGEFELHYAFEPTKRTRDAESFDLAETSSATVIRDEGAALGLHFLDDTAALENTTSSAAAAGAAAAGKPKADRAAAETDSEAFFQFADEEPVDEGPPISLPVPAPAPQQQAEPSKCPNCSRDLPPDARLCVGCGTNLATGQRMHTDAGATSPGAGSTTRGGSLTAYLKDCAWSAVLIFSLGNMLRFVLLSLTAVFIGVLAVIPVGFCLFGIFRLIGIVAATGWLCSYLFNVVESAAAGEEDLPDLSFSDGIWEDGIVPFFKFVAMSILVHVPLIAYVATLGLSAATVTQTDDPVLLGLIWSRALLFPMAMLITAVGGVGSFLRPDLIFKTILRSFLPYLATCAVTALALGTISVVTDAALSSTTIFGGSLWATMAVLLVLTIVCWIIAMRCIGLYYHHFKARFAWDWG
jgi:hypothetical protein